MTPLELSQAFKALKERVDAIENGPGLEVNEILVRIKNLENKYRMMNARQARKSEAEKVE